jgi:hypothetical protein
MTARMELVAGDAREVLVVVGSEGSRDAFRDPSRFEAYLALGGGMDPTWLDLFAEAVRTVTDQDDPPDFLDARLDLGTTEPVSEITVERVDPAWIDTVARLPDSALDGIAGRWIDRLEEEFGPIAREEKPWIRDLAGQVVGFCRAADRAPDVIFLWALR